jgi:hypothetical protein
VQSVRALDAELLEDAASTIARAPPKPSSAG